MGRGLVERVEGWCEGLRAGGSSWVRLEAGWRVWGLVGWDGVGMGGCDLLRWGWGWWREVGRFGVGGMGWGLMG